MLCIWCLDLIGAVWQLHTSAWKGLQSNLYAC